MALQNLQQYGCQTGNKLKEKSRDSSRNKGSRSNRPQTKSAQSQIGPKSNRSQVKSAPVKSAPSQIGPIFVVYYCQHAKLNSLNTIQQNI